MATITTLSSPLLPVNEHVDVFDQSQAVELAQSTKEAIMAIAQIEYLANCGDCGGYTDIGGHPVVALTEDGEFMCCHCVKENLQLIKDNSVNVTRHDGHAPEWNVIGLDVHYEGEPLECAHCGAHIESVYGIPD